MLGSIQGHVELLFTLMPVCPCSIFVQHFEAKQIYNISNQQTPRSLTQLEF